MPAYATKLEALRALRRIVSQNDDLLYEIQGNHPGNKWAFDMDAATYAAELEPEHDQRERYESLPTPKPKGTAMQDEEFQTDHDNDYVPGQVHNTSHKLIETKETVKLDALGKLAIEVWPQDIPEPEMVETSELEQTSDAQVSTKKIVDRASRDAELEKRRTEREARREIRRSERQTRLQESQKMSEARNEARVTRRRLRLEAENKKLAARDYRQTEREMNMRNNVALPGRGSKVGVLWGILDAMREWDEYKESQFGKFPTFQEFKAEIADLDYEVKGNDLTQSTAYYKYRIYHGITGRIVEKKSN